MTVSSSVEVAASLELTPLPWPHSDPREFAALAAAVAEPYLVGGRAFDLAVYVLASESPDGRLEFWTYDDVLLRFCRERFTSAATAFEQYARDPSALSALQRGWVVSDDYLSAWDMPELSAALRRPGARCRDALEEVLSASEPFDMQALWESIRSSVARTLGVVHAVSSPPQEQRRFELVRYDFVLDARHVPWLLEVNSGPNLSPRSEGQASQMRGLAHFMWDRLALGNQTKTRPASEDWIAASDLHAPIAAVGLDAEKALRKLKMRALGHEQWHTTTETSHSHTPHAHTPHTHVPHTHAPHTHTPHSHTTPSSPSPPASPPSPPLSPLPPSSPPPASPPPPPLPPFTPLQHTVDVEFTVQGDVATFDASLFQTNLATVLGVSPSQIELGSVSSGSVKVTATIKSASAGASATVQNTLTSVSSDLNSLSTSLGVTVQGVGTPLVTTLSPSPPLPPPPVPLVDEESPCFGRSATACRRLEELAMPHEAFDACFAPWAATDLTMGNVAERVSMAHLRAGDTVLAAEDGALVFSRVLVNQHRLSQATRRACLRRS